MRCLSFSRRYRANPPRQESDNMTTTVITTILTLAALVLCFVSLINALSQPSRAFHAAGYHKWAWVALLLVGMFTMIVGIVIWCVWRFRVSPRVVANGGRAARSPGAVSPPGYGSQQSFNYSPGTPAGPCTSASARCTACATDGNTYGACSVCGGHRMFPCGSCGQYH
jgi:hypothetical protein